MKEFVAIVGIASALMFSFTAFLICGGYTEIVASFTILYKQYRHYLRYHIYDITKIEDFMLTDPSILDFVPETVDVVDNS
jgi:hypothetical protein